MGALPCGRERILGGGAGCDSGDGVLKKESFRDRTEGGGGDDRRRGVVSGSFCSSALSLSDAGVDAEEVIDGDREIGGGGCSSELSENGEPKKACVLLPLAWEGDGDKGECGGASDNVEDIEEAEVRILK